MTILVILAFAGQIYIEKACITWHVINYPYSLTPFVCLWLGKMMDNEKEKITSKVCILLDDLGSDIKYAIGVEPG